jgi:hypothetical protein
MAYLGYITIYSVVRASGGRFQQEIDWIALVYYSIGIIELVKWLIKNIQPGLLSSSSLSAENQVSNITHPNPVLLPSVIAAGLLFMGSLPGLLEELRPNSYLTSGLQSNPADLLIEVEGLLSESEQLELLEFANQGGTIIHGKSFYPRYFELGERLIDSRPEVIGKFERRYTYPRTELFIIGSSTSWVVLPRIEIPGSLPHEGEVLVAGCLENGVLDALLVVPLDQDDSSQIVYWRDEGLLEQISCPLNWPGDE